MAGQQLEARIGFIGGGQMARALAGGLVASGLLPAGQLWAADPSDEARAAFAAAVPGAHVEAANRPVAEAVDTLVVAVKPQQMTAALADLGNINRATGPRHLVVSIAAGVATGAIAAALPEGTRIMRVMPNAPALIGRAACGFCRGPGATAADARLVEQLLSAVGTAHEVDESQLDAVTGLSGSGPAFVAVVIEALGDGGVRMGLPPDVARALAAETVRGAAEMVLTGESPAALIERVASPGGTTVAGLAALEERGLRETLIGAVDAATRRSVELRSQA